MDYQEQVENAKLASQKWRKKHPIVGVGELCVDWMVDDLTRSITDLLARAEAAEFALSQLKEYKWLAEYEETELEKIQNLFVTGYCSQCKKDQNFLWDIEKYGYTVHCPSCGSAIILCNKCDNHEICDQNASDGCAMLRKREYTKLIARAEEAEKRAEKAEKERDAAVFDLKRAEEVAEETYILINSKIQPVFDYSVYTAIHDSVSDIVDWEKDEVWRGMREE